jgi:hypothetical protein
MRPYVPTLRGLLTGAEPVYSGAGRRTRSQDGVASLASDGEIRHADHGRAVQAP